MDKRMMAKARQDKMKKAGSDRDAAMQAAKAASTRSPSGALTPREALQKMTKDRPTKAPRPKPRSVAFDPMTGIPPKGKQPPTKPMTTTPGDRPISTAPSTPTDRSPASPIPPGGFKGGYTPNPKKPTGPMTPMPNEGIGPIGPRPTATTPGTAPVSPIPKSFDGPRPMTSPGIPNKSMMAKGGKVSLSPKAKKSSSVGGVRKFSHGGKIDGCAVRGKTNTKKF